MKYLKVKKIEMGLDNRESNLKKDSEGNIIGYKQSKCTCRFILEDKFGEEFVWVAENKSLAESIKLIAENEDKKYEIDKKPWLLGRNMFFLSYLYEIYEKYLIRCGFRPNEKDLEKARRFKNGKD